MSTLIGDRGWADLITTDESTSRGSHAGAAHQAGGNARAAVLACWERSPLVETRQSHQAEKWRRDLGDTEKKRKKRKHF
jgi:hypothetical protein